MCWATFCSKRKTIAAIALVSVLFLVAGGCGDDDSPAAPTQTNPYSGVWSAVFGGSYTGDGSLEISTAGEAATTVLLTDGTESFTNTISFSVTATGQVSDGAIYYGGTQIGTISGQFTGNAGSGTYVTVEPSSGAWSASKN